MTDYTTIDGLRIYYREEGPACENENGTRGSEKLPLVLLLHGWGSNTDLFGGIYQLLSSRYRVAGMDMPGFGKSGEPKEPLDVDGFADFVVRFWETVYPDEKQVVLLGHSHGGRVILRMLSRDKALPFSVPKAVLVDSAGIVPVRTDAQKRKTSVYRFLRKTLDTTGLSKKKPELLDALQKRFGSADYAAASPVMRKSMVMCVNTDLQADMPKIKIPVLLIWGENDTATPISDGETMEKLMPEAGLARIAGAGHFSFLDQPVVFARIMASFFGLQ